MSTVLEAIAMTAEQVGRGMFWVAFVIGLVILAVGSYRLGGKAYLRLAHYIRMKRAERARIAFYVDLRGKLGGLRLPVPTSGYRSAAMNREIARPRREGTEDPDWFPNPNTIKWMPPWQKPYDRELQEFWEQQL